MRILFAVIAALVVCAVLEIRVGEAGAWVLGGAMLWAFLSSGIGSNADERGPGTMDSGGE